MTTPTERANAAFPGDDPTRSISLLTARQLAAVAIGEAVRDIQHERDAATREVEDLRGERESFKKLANYYIGKEKALREEVRQLRELFEATRRRDTPAPTYPDLGPALKRAHIRSSRLVATGAPSADDVERARPSYTSHDIDIAEALFTRNERTAIGWSDRADIAAALTAANAQGRAEMREEDAAFVEEYLPAHFELGWLGKEIAGALRSRSAASSDQEDPR